MQYSLGQVAAARRDALQGGSMRRRYRHKILPLAYATLDDGNGGILCDLSAEGAGIQAVGVLRAEQTVRLRFSLPNPKFSLEVPAEVRWANAYGRAGVRFVNIEPRLQRRLKDWIFRDLLARVSQEGRVWQGSEQAAPALLLSPTARSAILLERPEPVAEPQARPRPERGSSIVSRTLAELMDGLVLSCAVLLFVVVFLSITDSLPSWPMAAAIVAGVAAFCALMYWGVFARMGGGTAGARLARIGRQDSKTKASPREQEARFR